MRKSKCQMRNELKIENEHFAFELSHFEFINIRFAFLKTSLTLGLVFLSGLARRGKYRGQLFSFVV
ncbi:hypothetical protein GCM10028827_40880 [Mucilaginibacter myungsuensis]